MDSIAHIKPGTTIDIQRTNGRVHAAVISSVNVSARSVSVEWTEKGETKGKEVDVDALLQLNPNLIPSSVEIHKSASQKKNSLVSAWQEAVLYRETQQQLASVFLLNFIHPTRGNSFPSQWTVTTSDTLLWKSDLIASALDFLVS
ncbi:hypothetical protein QYM36_002628, partial [Artemia franciscana]